MNRFFQFMQGRYGVDAYGVFLMVTSFLFNVPRIFVTNVWAYRALYLLSTALFLYALFRALSKNINRRAAENRRFVKIKTGVVNLYRNIAAAAQKQKAQRADKEHRYFHCPSCRQEIRVPARRGKIRITCPKCGRKFKKRT